jgi:hypothetical protein
MQPANQTVCGSLRKGRHFRRAATCRLRQNRDCGIGSRQKPAPVEELKTHCEMKREHTESCGKNWARCGKLMATGGV